ncbi:MAG TPA: isoprenylcysteine carboxylmethyltransferase family protein [Candidatus Binataceae bacterium]
MQVAAGRIGAPIKIAPSPITVGGLRHATANIALAASFFVTALPNANRHDPSLASIIWMVGAAIMGAFSLFRIPPRTVMITKRSIIASAGMMLLPCLMRPGHPAAGIFAGAAIVLELVGVVLSQVARIYMGRSFGILPANRGIVSTGPFAWMRHPIYTGWLILSLGFALSYPSVWNFFFLAASLPFMVWRIELEEALLHADPQYLAYQEHVRFRLWPGLA